MRLAFKSVEYSYSLTLTVNYVDETEEQVTYRAHNRDSLLAKVYRRLDDPFVTSVVAVIAKGRRQ